MRRVFDDNKLETLRLSVGIGMYQADSAILHVFASAAIDFDFGSDAYFSVVAGCVCTKDFRLGDKERKGAAGTIRNSYSLPFRESCS